MSDIEKLQSLETQSVGTYPASPLSIADHLELRNLLTNFLQAKEAAYQIILSNFGGKESAFMKQFAADYAAETVGRLQTVLTRIEDIGEAGQRQCIHMLPKDSRRSTILPDLFSGIDLFIEHFRRSLNRCLKIQGFLLGPVAKIGQNVPQSRLIVTTFRLRTLPNQSNDPVIFPSNRHDCSPDVDVVFVSYP
jgi:hypothetical protein